MPVELAARCCPRCKGRPMACAGCRHGQRHHLSVIQVCENAKKEGAESTPSYGEPGGIRTHDLLIRSQTLYPAELRAPSASRRISIISQRIPFVNTFFDIFSSFLKPVVHPGRIGACVHGLWDVTVMRSRTGFGRKRLARNRAKGNMQDCILLKPHSIQFIVLFVVYLQE